MPIDIQCSSCGKQLRVSDAHAGRRAKCPSCGEGIQIPTAQQGISQRPGVQATQAEANPYSAPPPPITVSNSPVRTLASVSGPAAASFGSAALSPAMFGKTTLTLKDDRVVEETKRIIARRNCQILLSEIESAEILHSGNPLLLLLGIITLPLFGLGLLFLILYFFIKYRFLILRSGANLQIVVIKGDEGRFLDFMNSVLSAARDSSRR